jgi:hypothetical protein
MGNEQTPVTIYLNDNAYRLANKDIPDIFDYINDVAGEKIITATAATLEGGRHPVFNIVVLIFRNNSK